VIGELEEKKNEALRTTWAKVNKDFGSIFSTLLPGVTAKLDPPEGGSVLDGLEVKVAFNGVWKETLTDLSGGQRSLLALSLILALLLFKPAPMYILDEVDAALDLSHTQNIGKMIRSHFSKSQFIVVSLKQGMFGNANVIFRTKFVEGIGSTVTRTVPAGSALLADAAGEGAAGAGAGSSSGRAALGAVGGAGRKKGAGAGAGAGSASAAAHEDADDEAAYAGAGGRVLKGGVGAGAGARRRAAGAGAGAADEE
jgi:structural maintenance of chromosome 2